MDPERWQHIKTIVHSALTLTGPERDSYVTRTCGNNEQLRKEIEQLLLSIEASEEARFLNKLALDRNHFLSDITKKWQRVSSRTQWIGRQIGPYTITRLLGIGGMGSVFKAKRTDGAFHQTVAIKMIRKELENRENIERFRMEQEILARLYHPNIAQLYDGGLTEDGTPYLVMEFVDGTPIDEYCNKNTLTIPERLECFRDVCEAVLYAHSHLVIHRDLKTKNILVTPNGIVKILDFGVAKLLSPEFTDITLPETQPGQKFWTPHYAAPEQVKGEPVTIATDVYALGTLLYKILTDTYPLKLEGKNAAEIERLILEHPPVSTSQIYNDEDELKRCAALRSTSPSEFRKTLSGDLDALIRKAIRKEAAYRYRSVEQLLDDMDRYKKRLPLIARKGTIRYRFSKFTKRNKTILSAIVLVLMVTMVMGIYHVSKLTEQRNIAELEAAKARTTQDYLVGLFEETDPAANRGEQITVQEIVQRGIDRLEEDLASEPEVHIEMLKVLGRVEQALGDFDLSSELLEEALIKTRELRGARHLDVAITAAMLGEILRWAGEFDQSEYLLREALEIRRNLTSEDDADIAIDMHRLARTLEMKGDFEEAETLYSDALAMRERLFGENSDAVAANLSSLGWLLNEMGKRDEAEQTLRQALEIKNQILESPHPAISSNMGNLAVVLRSKGNYREAEEFAKQALEQEIKLYGDDHPRVTTALNNRSLILLDLARYKDAAEQYQKIIENNRRQLGSDHFYVGFSLSGLAIALIEDGRSEEALPFLEEAIEITQNALGEEHRYYAMSLSLKGEALYYQNPNHAIPILERAKNILIRTAGPDHPSLGRTLTGLGRTQFAIGEFEAAESTFREALRIQREALPSHHPNIIRTLTNLGRLLAEQGQTETAESLLREATVSAEALPPNHWRRIAARLELGACLLAGGQVLPAREETEKVLAELEARTDFHAIRLKTRALELQNSIIQRKSEINPGSL